MSCFAERCGVFDAAAHERLLGAVRVQRLERVRFAWADLHGLVRGKTLMPSALPSALADGVGLVSTLLLKDASDRTAIKVFEPGTLDSLPGFGRANNLLLLADPASLTLLPWAPGTGWLRGELWCDDGTPLAVDPRRVLRSALEQLAAAGFGLTCGLEVEFHVYRIVDDGLDPVQPDWPGEPPRLAMIHPGGQLLGEALADQAADALAIVERTALALGLPLRSLEIELGPSQVEAVFDAVDALTAADHMVLFRNGVKQALRRAGYHASFACRPPFPNVMASGWHLHQSLVDQAGGRNAFVRAAAAGARGEAGHSLSDVGAAWLAGLLEHARAATAFAVPTVNGYGRFKPNAMAPVAACWGRDNRGAMLRVLGGAGDAATRIENRIGEPAANPYLYIASQVHAGLDGLRRRLVPPPASDTPYASGAPALPASLTEALDAFDASDVLPRAFGVPLSTLFTRVKRFEAARHAEAADGDALQRREYFGRF